jgi:hypothetical protein
MSLFDGRGITMGLAQTTVTFEGSGFAWGMLFVWFAVFYAITVIPYWVIFTKAGLPGWPAVIPIYSFFVLLKVVGRPWWWFVLLLIPLVGFVIYIIITNDLSKSFGHGAGFTLGLLFLSLIFYYILAFGSSTYRGPAGAAAGMAAPPLPPMPAG